MKTKITTYRENGYHEISHTMRFPFNDEINLDKVRYVSLKDILKSEEIREYLSNALQARIGACTSQLFKNYNNVIRTSEYYIQFILKSSNKIHSYNIPTVNAMNDMIKWLNEGGCNIAASPQAGWEQLIKALYWVDKPTEEWTVLIEGIPVKVSFGDLISAVWEGHIISISKYIT